MTAECLFEIRIWAVVRDEAASPIASPRKQDEVKQNANTPVSRPPLRWSE
jgi:hypothetical protein